MRVGRASSIKEYARWYLQRDLRKHPGQNADDSGDPVEVMWRDHRYKMRDWFMCPCRIAKEITSSRPFIRAFMSGLSGANGAAIS